MALISIEQFGGMVPAVDSRLLPVHAAAHSENAWLYSGALVGLPEPKVVHTLVEPSATMVYRIPDSFLDAEHMVNSTWMEFVDPFTDVIRSPIVEDTFVRYYWASPTSAPMYNTQARITNGDDPWILGIPAPGTPPSVTPSGGVSAVTVTRSYVHTWVSEYGEEGPPSDPTVVTGKVDDTWAVTLTAASADDLGGVGDDRFLADSRIYRTVTASNGTTTYFLVVEQAIADTTYDDTLADEDITSGTALESTGWVAPPSGLEGWVSMPNGIIAGWKDNEIWFCEPFRPHAWPAAYALSVEYPVIGLGVVGQTLVVCTAGFPVAITGSSPATMTQSTIATLEPCTARRSILSTVGGVYYSSQNGLVVVTNGAATNITRNLITQDRWRELAPIETLVAARMGTGYYAFGALRQGIFDPLSWDQTWVELTDLGGAKQGVIIEPADARVALNVLSSDDAVSNVLNDPWTGEVLIIKDGDVLWLDLADIDQPKESYIWRSKKFQSSKQRNLGVIQILFEVPAGTTDQALTRNTDAVQTLAVDQYGLVRVYADDELVMTRELWSDGEIMKIPSGFKAFVWQVEVEGRVSVKALRVASSARELGNAAK